MDGLHARRIEQHRSRENAEIADTVKSETITAPAAVQAVRVASLARSVWQFGLKSA
jgi:hypothetical protein